MRGEEKPELKNCHIGKLGQSGSPHEMTGPAWSCLLENVNSVN